MNSRILFVAMALALTLVGCEDGTSVVETNGEDTLEVQFDPLVAEGTFQHAEQVLTYQTKVFEASIETTLELRGMVLTMTVDTQGGAIEIDGFAAENGQETQMLDADVAFLRLFEARLTETYLKNKQDSPALDHLVRALTVWGGFTTSQPLKQTYHGRFDRSASLCSSVNMPGQGVDTRKWVTGTHDCLTNCHWFFGCQRGDDGSTTDFAFMSMHPKGSCMDATYFGSAEGGFSCYEPDHLENVEYAYGSCLGRCGPGCGAGTQFTQGCLDHDQCVRGGHSITSLWCLNEFEEAAIDTLFAPHCGGHMTVDYNWAGSGNEGNCSEDWNGSDDGCDHGCQFIDGDCFR